MVFIPTPKAKKSYTKTADDFASNVSSTTIPSTANNGDKRDTKDASYASVVPFSALCNLFEHASKQPKSVEKKRKTQKFHW